MAHKCDYCKTDFGYLEVLIKEYRQAEIDADAEIASLGGYACPPEENRERIQDLASMAAGKEDDRCEMQVCVDARWVPGM